jgi:hypothetical protein
MDRIPPRRKSPISFLRPNWSIDPESAWPPGCGSFHQGDTETLNRGKTSQIIEVTLQIRDLQSRFKKTIPVSDGFFKLMQNTFEFYSNLCNDFFTNLGRHIEANTLGNFLQNEIRPKLFDKTHCRTIELTKKQFLAENIKLDQFIEQNAFKEDFINDLSALKKVSDAIYELLQTHWEFYKYEKSVANNEVMIAFILEIDRVGIRWDSYLEKYLAIFSILKVAEGESERAGYTPLLVRYHLPENTSFPIEMSTNLILFLKTAYEFVVKVNDQTTEPSELEVSTLEVRNPVNCLLTVPSHYWDSYRKFLGYCSVDVLKRETLLKFVMEVVRLQQGKEVPKATVTSFQKKLANQLNDLHPEGYLSVDCNEGEDSVDLLTSLCNEMDRLEIRYKDMLTGATDRLARNRKQSLADMTSSAIKTSQLKTDADTAESPPTTDPPSEAASTVKIDIKSKEHIQYLTS